MLQNEDMVLFQQQVGGMQRNKEGYYVGLPFYPTEESIAGETLQLAKPVFYQKDSGLQAVFASGDVFAGLLPAANQNSWTWADTANGRCMAVSARSNVGVANKGKITVVVDTCFSGDAKFGDVVFAHKSNQTWAVGVTDQTDYVKTTFVVINGGPQGTEIDICNTIPSLSGAQ